MTQADTPRLELVMRIEADIAPALVVGEVGGGIREIIPITGGRFEGPGLRGQVVPGGADWCLTRPDGISEIWARYTLRTHDGVLISLINAGTVQVDETGDFRGRTVPQFEVADGPYAWLRDAAFVGTLLTNAEGTLAKATFYRLA
jgi:hypothetical protein